MLEVVCDKPVSAGVSIVNLEGGMRSEIVEMWDRTEIRVGNHLVFFLIPVLNQYLHYRPKVFVQKKIIVSLVYT